MAGQDHVLSKAFLATGNAAYIFGQLVLPVAGTSLDPNQMVIAPANSGGISAPTPLGLVQENLDLVKVTTSKAYGNVAIAGIAFAIYNTGTLTVGVPLIPSVAVAGRLDATPQGVTGRPMIGIYMGGGGGILGGGTTAAVAAGDIIAVLLTPGARC
jgi:hypothetical protein